jgi:hypothetical protein
MKNEAIRLSFTELWNRRTVKETNSLATWSHPDLSATVTNRQNNGFEVGSILRAIPQYMHCFKIYNLMSNRKTQKQKLVTVNTHGHFPRKVNILTDKLIQHNNQSHSSGQYYVGTFTVCNNCTSPSALPHKMTLYNCQTIPEALNVPSVPHLKHALRNLHIICQVISS